MANIANHATSLGLLVAVLAAILAATRRTPATAGAALPLLAAANGRQPTRRTGSGRATARKDTGKANGARGKAPRGGNGQASTAAPARKARRGQAEPSAAPAVNPVSGTQRLRPGKLQEQVLAYLAEHAGEELSPSHIAKALGRSSGAVGNGLESLAKDGEVRKTREAPRRFMVPARGTAKRNGSGQAAAPKPTRASRGTRKAGNGPSTTGNGSNGKGNGGNGAKTEPPATPDRTPAAKPAGGKPATRRARNHKAGAAADEAAATGT
jgi:hypothetical protein